MTDCEKADLALAIQGALDYHKFRNPSHRVIFLQESTVYQAVGPSDGWAELDLGTMRVWFISGPPDDVRPLVKQWVGKHMPCTLRCIDGWTKRDFKLRKKEDVCR